METLWLDFETRSTVDLKTAGVHRYAEHPDTGVWCYAFRRGDEETRFCLGDETPPADLVRHVETGGLVVAHNAVFERTIWNKVLRRDFDWLPELRIEQTDCTLARACALGIPADLDGAAGAVDLPFRKDEEGSRVMMRMMRPRRVEADGTLVWWDEPDRVQRLVDYCKQDVLVESELDKRLPNLTDRERRIWLLDQEINERGVKLDVPLIERMLEIAAYARRQLDKRMAEVTSGQVKTCNQLQPLKAWLAERGLPQIDSLDKEHLADYLSRDSLSAEVREVLKLRQQGSKNSTAKFETMMSCVCGDGRARGQLFYHGAQPGRWSGRLIQPQNLYRIDPEKDDAGIHLAIEIALSRMSVEDAHDAINCIVDDPMTALAKTMRSMFVSEEL